MSEDSTRSERQKVRSKPGTTRETNRESISKVETPSSRIVKETNGDQTSSMSHPAKHPGVETTGSSAGTSAESATSISTTTTTKTVAPLEAYHGDPGVARYLWWALALLAGLLALSLFATQCGTSSNPNADSPPAANTAVAKAVDIEGTRAADVAESANDGTDIETSNRNGTTADGNSTQLGPVHVAVSQALVDAGYGEIEVAADGERVILIGDAIDTNEATNILSLAVTVDGANQVINQIDITQTVAEPPASPIATPKEAEPAYNG